MTKLIPQFKLKIIHSGLILVSVPLIFGLIMTLVLNSALQKALQTRKQVTRIAVASAAINRFSNDSVEYRGDLQTLDLSGKKKEKSKLRLESDAANVRKDLQELENLVEKHAQYKEQLKEIIPAARDVVAQVDSTSTNSAKESTELNDSITKLKMLAEDHAALLKVDAEVQKQPTGSIQELVSWLISSNMHQDRTVQQVLAWLLAANIIACPLLVLYFSQNVVRRLSVLIANTERFERDKELLDPVGGTDEIAHLDNVFRDMAQRITIARQERAEVERLRKEYVAMIGHDLRTPLSAVQGTLTLLADGVYGDISDSGINKAKVAEQSIERLTNLANELLDVEKLESHKLPISLKEVALGEVIQNSIKSLEGFASYKHVNIKAMEVHEKVMADEARLTQIIVNLLSNAIKFSEDGANVEVIVATRSDGNVEIKVIDEGRGIDPEKQSEVFDRFKQAEAKDADNERGLGLGLAICKALVENHGGEIGVENNATKGCTFWFTLKPVEHKIKLQTAQEVT